MLLHPGYGTAGVARGMAARRATEHHQTACYAHHHARNSDQQGADVPTGAVGGGFTIFNAVRSEESAGSWGFSSRE